MSNFYFLTTKSKSPRKSFFVKHIYIYFYRIFGKCFYFLTISKHTRSLHFWHPCCVGLLYSVVYNNPTILPKPRKPERTTQPLRYIFKYVRRRTRNIAEFLIAKSRCVKSASVLVFRFFQFQSCYIFEKTFFENNREMLGFEIPEFLIKHSVNQLRRVILVERVVPHLGPIRIVVLL